MKSLIVSVSLFISVAAGATQPPSKQTLLFTATWCGPCQAAIKANPTAVLVDVDTASAELMKKYNVVTIPKLVEVKK